MKISGSLSGLCYLLVEAEAEHETGTCQAERKGHPYSGQAPVEDETEDVAGWERNHEIGDKGDVHYRLDIGDPPQGIGVGALQSVSELVDNEREHQL